MKLLLPKFGIDILDVFDAGEVVASAAILWRLKCSIRIASKAATIEGNVGANGSSVSLPASETP